MAKSATNDRETRTTKLTLQEANYRVHNEIRSKWNEVYTNSSTGQHYRKLFPTIFETNCLTMFSRRYQVIIFRLQTGHCKLRGHLHRIGMVDSPLCPNCRTEETVSHFLLFCARFQAERSYTIEAVRNHNTRFTLRNLLTDHRIMNATVEFVLASGHLDTYYAK